MTHQIYKEQNAYKIHLLILYCQLNNQNESHIVRLNTDRIGFRFGWFSDFKEVTS